MTLIFGNGGTPSGNNPYPGLTYTTGTGLLTLLQTNLTSAGWTTQPGYPTADTLQMAGTTGVHGCLVEFVILTSPTNLLQVRVGSTTTGIATPTSKHILQFTPGQTNKIFITADTFAGAIANFPFTGTGEILHFGFPQLIYPATDSRAIYIGKAFTMVDNSTYPVTLPPGSCSAYDLCYVVESAANNTLSTRLSTGYTTSNTITPITGSYRYPIHTVFNINSSNGLGGTTQTSTTNTNVSYYSYLGGNDTRTGLPIIAPYYYLEGRATDTSYGSTAGVGVAPTMHMRGLIPFIATGFSHLPSFSQWNTSSGKVYITGDISFQGMRIA